MNPKKLIKKSSNVYGNKRVSIGAEIFFGQFDVNKQFSNSDTIIIDDMSNSKQNQILGKMFNYDNKYKCPGKSSGINYLSASASTSESLLRDDITCESTSDSDYHLNSDSNHNFNYHSDLYNKYIKDYYFTTDIDNFSVPDTHIYLDTFTPDIAMDIDVDMDIAMDTDIDMNLNINSNSSNFSSNSNSNCKTPPIDYNKLKYNETELQHYSNTQDISYYSNDNHQKIKQIKQIKQINENCLKLENEFINYQNETENIEKEIYNYQIMKEVSFILLFNINK